MTIHIVYEALVYNFPVCDGYEFEEHSFIRSNVTKEIEQKLNSLQLPLLANPTFLACITNTVESGQQFMVMKNKNSIPYNLIDADGVSKSAAFKYTIANIIRLERHLLLNLNFPVFFPVIWIKLVSEKGRTIENYVQLRNVPIFSPGGKWASHLSFLDINKRLNFKIKMDSFENFLSNKNRTRFKSSCEYYIRSFYETSHETAFCSLISSIDAITGSRSKERLTKARLAKYSSILLCEPSRMGHNESNLKLFYKLRSEFVHGKGSRISVTDEFVLREYVRIFLIAYYFFWQELKVKNEPQMLQILDQIYDNHELYVKMAPSSYSFISAMRKHESGYETIFGTSIEEQKRSASRILMEPFVSQHLKNDSEQ